MEPLHDNQFKRHENINADGNQRFMTLNYSQSDKIDKKKIGNYLELI